MLSENPDPGHGDTQQSGQVPESELWREKAPQDLERDLLKAGVIPERVTEELRLAEEELSIHEQLRGILKSLLEPYASAEELALFDRVKLRLADISQCFGFALTEINPPIVGLDRAGLDPTFEKSPKSLDALIGLIVHEFAHVVFAERYPHEGNSKPEEALADIIAIQKLFEWGLDPRAYRDFLKELHDPNVNEELSRARRMWSIVLDPHPVTSSRVAYVEAEITRLEQKSKEIDRTPLPLPDPNPFVPLLDNLRHYSSFDRDAGVQHLGVIRGFVTSSESWNRARQTDVKEELKRLTRKIDLNEPSNQVALGEVADSLIARMSARALRLQEGNYKDDWVAQERRKEVHGEIVRLLELFNLVCEIGHPSGTQSVVGRLQIFSECAETAVSGAEVSQQVNALERIAELASSDPFLAGEYTRGYARGISWPNFPFPEKVGDTVAWQNVFEEAKQRAAGGNDSALLGLIYLGIEDARIYQHLSSESVLLVLDRLQHLSTGKVHDYPSSCGIARGPTEEVLLETERRDGSSEEREQNVGVIGIRIEADGTVGRIPTKWKEYWEQMSENNLSRAQALYREDLFQALDQFDAAKLLHPKVVESRLGDLRSEFGPAPELTQIELLLSDTDRFVALNGALLSDYDVQRVVCRELDRLAEQANTEEERAKVSQAAQKFFSSGMGLTLSRTMKGLSSLFGDEEENDADVEGEAHKGLSPFLVYQYTEGHGFTSRKEKLETFSADLDYLPSKSERVLYRPIFEKLFPGIPSVTRSWSELTESVFRVKEVLCEALLADVQDAEERDWILRHEIEKNLDGFAELLMDVASAPKPTLDEVCALLEVTRSVALSDRDPLPSIRDVVLELLDQPREYSRDPLRAVNQWKLLTTGYQLLKDEDTNPDIRRILEQSDWRSVSRENEVESLEVILASRDLRSMEVAERAVDQWSDAIVAVLGKDDQSEKYQEALTPVLERIKEFPSAPFRKMAFEQFARKCELQANASFHVRSFAKSLEAAFSGRAAIYAIGGELSLEAVKEDDELRRDMIDFLCAPPRLESAEALLSKYKNELFRFGQVVGLESTPASHQARYHSEQVTAIRMVHSNLWALPVEGRALAGRELLIPAGTESDEAYEQAFAILFEKICPKDSLDHAEASEFIRAYIEILPEHARPIFLGALLTASHPEEGVESSLGKALTVLAASMGPIENKVIQGAHSFHRTPEHIRRDIRRSKTLIAEPNQWELHELIQQVVPDSIRSEIKHVGEVLGAASFFVSVKVELADGEHVVLQLLRPNARDRAETGLRRLRSVAEKLVLRDPRYRTLLELCDEAERSFRSEVNLAESKLKSDSAQEMYDGSSVRVPDGSEIPIGCCRVLEREPYGTLVGEQWRIISLAKGQPFLEAVEQAKTLENRSDPFFVSVRNKALALAARELGRAVSGSSMDDDWHSGNVIDGGSHLTRIDIGSITVVPPSSEELTDLGRALASALRKRNSQENPSSMFLYELRRREETGEGVPSLLRRFQKSLLILDEYRPLFSGEEIEWLMSTVFASAHPNVLAGFSADSPQ
ncbi:MAG: hypothetical protein KDD64_09965 [Bdellovibrionales bacterium]|nr:hypothetical protein [Bdellovibrionales bacterium]